MNFETRKNLRGQDILIFEDMDFRAMQFIYLDGRPDNYGNTSLHFNLKVPEEIAMELAETYEINVKDIDSEYAPHFKVNVNNDRKKASLPEISIISGDHEIFLNPSEYNDILKYNICKIDVGICLGRKGGKTGSSPFRACYLDSMICYAEEGIFSHKHIRRKNEEM